MKIPCLALIAATSALLTGCIVTSLHPFYTAKDLVYDPALVGQWTNTEKADELWTFEKEGQKSYLLTCVADHDTNKCQVHMFKLGTQTFLDWAGSDDKLETFPPPIPSHLVLRVVQMTPTLRLVALDHDWLKELLDKDPGAVHHMLVGPKPGDGRVVLTAETAELQAFLAKHLNTTNAWKDPIDLKPKS